MKNHSGCFFADNPPVTFGDSPLDKGTFKCVELELMQRRRAAACCRRFVG